MDFDKILSALEFGLKSATLLASAGEALGLPSQVATAANIASALLETATNVKEVIDNGKIVATSTDAAKVQSIIADIQAANDELAAKIAAS